MFINSYLLYNNSKLNSLREELNSLGNISTSSSWSNNIEAMSLNVSKGKLLDNCAKP